jgi:glycosyltransferase involved in cell wall biosynthesis
MHPGLLQKISAIGPDVIVGDGLFKWTTAALAYRLWTGVPLVVNYERTPHTERRAQWYRRWYRKLVLRWIDMVNCNGRLCQEYVRSLGVAPDHLRTGHMVADFEGLQRQAKKTDGSRKADLRRQFEVQGILLLFVGRLIERKGLEQLLLAWQGFERRHRESATLLIVGSGPQEEQLRNLGADLGLEAVRFAGRVHHDEIATMYAAADALVTPTLEDNWSLVVPEAMSCGLPILCSIYNGGWPELLRDGENGWLFDPLDRASIEDALEKLVEGEQMLATMGERSVEIIAGGHTPGHAARSILGSCRQALRRRRGRRR